jgi:hypothetical protein
MIKYNKKCPVSRGGFKIAYCKSLYLAVTVCYFETYLAIVLNKL